SSPLTFTYVGTATNTTLTGSNLGNNVFDLGPGGDTVTGGNSSQGGPGLNTYVFGSGDGKATINANGGTGTLDFMSGIMTNEIWFEQKGNDLQVDLMGSADHVTVANWFGGASSQIQTFATADGSKLDTQISQL